jgi:hypothetical protein
VNVHLVALASSAYFRNAERFGRVGTLATFAGRISWADVHARYPDPLFQQADRIYRMTSGEMLLQPV